MGIDYTTENMNEALRAFNSSISKCEKAKEKLKENSPQHKWVNRQLEAFYISVSLIELSLGETRGAANQYTAEELASAGETIKKLIETCEKLPDKFKDGSPQRTLAIRRLEALYIAQSLVGGVNGDL